MREARVRRKGDRLWLDEALLPPFHDAGAANETDHLKVLVIAASGLLLSAAIILLFGARGAWEQGLATGAAILFLTGGGLLYFVRRARANGAALPREALSDILTTISQPAALCDKGGRLLFCNDAYRLGFGEIDPIEAKSRQLAEGGGLAEPVPSGRYRVWLFDPLSPTAEDTPRDLLQMLGEGLARLEIGIAYAGDGAHLDAMNEQLLLWLGIAAAEDIPELTARSLLDGSKSELKSGGGGTLVKSVIGPLDGAGGKLVLVERPKPAGMDAGAVDMTLLRSLFDAAPVGLALVSPEGALIEFNKTFKRFAPNRLPRKGDLIESYVTAEDRDAVRSRLGEVIETSVPASPVDIGFNTQPARTGQIYISPVEHREPRAALFHLIDTTQQKSLERQFVQAQKMQVVGQLAGGVAHDFNNLLTAIIGFCDLLLVRHGPGDQSFSDIMQIKQNANRAANLVRQLLAFSRQQTMRPKVLVITDVLADLSNLLRRLIGETIELKMIHGRDVGAVRVDQGQLEQVIINLAVNARDAMSEGGQLTIRTKAVGPDDKLVRHYSVMPPDHYVLIEVTDSGHGIPPDILNKIFEPFFTTKDVGKGTGLGLSTVYGIIKQTGGFIFVESAEGEGATFRVYLPVHAEAQRETVREEAAAAVDLTGKGTILLVEDEEAVRMFASRALANKGYSVLQAASGEEALEIVRSESGRIDLLISDVVMPNMDGPTLVRKALELRADLRVIFISGYAEDAFRKNLGTDSHAFAFLPKPFSLKQLAETVKQTLG